MNGDERCESCGNPANVMLIEDGSTWCWACDASARTLGYDDKRSRPVARRRWRCFWRGHDRSAWFDGMSEPLLCARCGRVAKEVCGNCGRVHDPAAFLTICTVTRGGWRD